MHGLEMQTLVTETAKAAAACSKEAMVQVAALQVVTGPLVRAGRAVGAVRSPASAGMEGKAGSGISSLSSHASLCLQSLARLVLQAGRFSMPLRWCRSRGSGC
jgi:hypothetical protein